MTPTALEICRTWRPTSSSKAGETVKCTFYNLLEMDLGDAPDSYMTRLAVDGARHVIVAGHSLGPSVDPELDGQPSAAADLDDLLPAPDDEDGVIFPTALVAGSQGTVRVDGGPAGGELDAWIDFNHNGAFDHTTEHLWGGTSQTLEVGGPQDLTFAVPADAVAGGGTSPLNLEYSALVAAGTGTDLLPFLTANDAQVAVGGAVANSVVSAVTPSDATPAAGEQIVVTIHMDMTGVAVPDNSLGSLAGSLSWDPAVLDYVSDSGLMAGFSSEVTVNEAAGQIGFAGSHPTGVAGSGTALTITLNVLGAGTTYARFRLSVAGGLSPSGFAADGEVEDYQVQIQPQPFTVTFDPNGGTGTMSPQTASVATALTLNAFTQVGYSFTGWNTAADGTGTDYADGAVYDFGADITLYARWSANCYVLTLGHTGNGSDPVPTPANSDECATQAASMGTPVGGLYVYGEAINLSGAVPDTG